MYRPILLAFALAATCAITSPCAAKEPSLDELLSLYKDLGLPLPPRDATLVRYPITYAETINGKSQEKKAYALAFQIQPASALQNPKVSENGPLLFFEDFEVRRAWNLDEVPKEIGAEPSAADGLRFGSTVLAIQCHARGWTKLAERILDLARKKQEELSLFWHAWFYWERQTQRPKIDRAPAARHLEQIIRLDKEHDTKRNRDFIRSLKLALVPSKAKPGSIEAMIDQLVDSWNERADDDWVNLWEPDMRLSPLQKLGFEAVPTLIEYMGDERLTRFAASGGFNNHMWSHHWRVGEIVNGMLNGLAGRKVTEEWDEQYTNRDMNRSAWLEWKKDKVKNWFGSARQVGEERYVVENVLFPISYEPRLAYVNDTHLELINGKYPRYLPEIYRRVLNKYPKTMPVFAHVVGGSALPEKEKNALLEEAARNSEAKQRCAALRVLKKTNKDRFDALLPPAIEALPNDVESWSGGGPDELGLVNFTLESSESKVWSALEKAARNAKVGFRVMILRQQLSFRDEMQNKRERLGFLARFLTDPTVYDREENKERYPFFEPAAYEEIEVRNVAALAIAELLEIKVEVTPKRTSEEWAKVRADLEAALRRELNKPKP